MLRPNRQILFTFAALACLAWPRSIAAQSGFSDDFEAPTFNPFWTVTQQQGGAVSLCTGQNHTPGGKQSACFSAFDVAGQKGLSLQHQFISPTSGDFSVWFYDSLQTYYNFLHLNSSAGPSVFVGTQDFDPSCYSAALDTSAGRIGPNANCGPFPQASTTPLLRSIGWHKFEINVANSSLSILIDGVQVLSVSGRYSFDLLTLESFGPEATSSTTYFDDFSLSTGCQLDPASLKVFADVPDSLDGHPTSIKATFTPTIAGNPETLANAARMCGFAGFDWIQTITTMPCVSPFHASFPSALEPQNICAANGSLTAPPAFNDPPPGGYTYLPGYNPFPFYYPSSAALSQEQFPGSCVNVAGTCIRLVSSDDLTLGFFDAPANPCLPGGNTLLFCGGFANSPGSFMGFTTSLVGILQGGSPSPTLLDSNGHPFQWSWTDTYNGTSGGIPTTFNTQPVDPGGTGGIRVVSIGNVLQTPPDVMCSATPDILWPPDGKSVQVTLSGTVTAGTAPIVPGAVDYSVMDEYGLVQPSGNISFDPGGTFSVGVPLIASRKGNDPDGRRYTIVVTARDQIGNAGSCSITVIVPHDQGN
jgi:hypothetical protein